MKALAISGFKKGIEGLFMMLTVWGVVLGAAGSLFLVWKSLSWSFRKLFKGKAAEETDTTAYTISDPSPVEGERVEAVA